MGRKHNAYKLSRCLRGLSGRQMDACVFTSSNQRGDDDTAGARWSNGNHVPHVSVRIPFYMQRAAMPVWCAQTCMTLW